MHIQPITETRPCRPGERMVDGRPYVFNLRLLNEHEARERVAAVGGLRALPLSELALLISDCRSLSYEPDYPEDLHRRLVAERARRGIDTGGATVGAVLSMVA